jgi:hypothetical protein
MSHLEITKINVIVINTNGKFDLVESNINELQIINNNTNISSPFSKIYNWIMSDKKYSINVYGNLKGNDNNINKFELPPPLDNTFFYGKILIVKSSVFGQPLNYSIDEWNNDYDLLYGGFEDINEEDTDEDSDDSLDNYKDSEKTTSGYLLDDFVVNDDIYSSDEDINLEDNKQYNFDFDFD